MIIGGEFMNSLLSSLRLSTGRGCQCRVAFTVRQMETWHLPKYVILKCIKEVKYLALTTQEIIENKF